MDTSTANLIWIIAFLVDLAIKIAALIIIPRRRKPTAAMAWLLAIFLIPYVGIILYLLIGTFKLPKKRRDEQARIDEIIRENVRDEHLETMDITWPRWFQRVVQQNEKLTGIPASNGNQATLLGDYQGSIDAMAAEIDTAQKFVHVEFFIVAWDDTTRGFFAAMERAVARGVTVRLLADHLPSAKIPGSKETFAELDRIGVKWSWMLPVQPLKGKYQRPDLRNHRKLLIIDGKIGYMGSQNMIDRSYNKRGNIRRGLQWQDLMTRLDGPIVAGLNAIFITDWYSETNELLMRETDPITPEVVEESPDSLDCQVVPSGPGFEGENNLRLFLALLYYAQNRIIVTSPYFVPDEAMLYAITTATQRGVQVELFVSEIGDQGLVYHAQRSYYEALLRAGVRIYMYQAPYILHAKHFTIDDDVAVIGSSNMDMRSFSLNMEVSLMVRGRSFVSEMREIEDGYRKVSRELTLDEWLTQPLRSTILDNLARLTSALQ